MQDRVEEPGIVQCPGCHRPMAAQERIFVKSCGYSYVCATCAMETKRTVDRTPDKQPLQASGRRGASGERPRPLAAGELFLVKPMSEPRERGTPVRGLSPAATRNGTNRSGTVLSARRFHTSQPSQVWTMDKEHIKGAADKVKGAVKDTVGKVTGDTKMQAEGKLDKAKGSARNAVGDVKDAARDATDNE